MVINSNRVLPSIEQKKRYSVADTIPIGGAIYWAPDTVCCYLPLDGKEQLAGREQQENGMCCSIAVLQIFGSSGT